MRYESDSERPVGRVPVIKEECNHFQSCAQARPRKVLLEGGQGAVPW